MAMLSGFKAKISAWLDKGESVQIIAPYGFGKSRFGRSLDGLFLDPNILQTPEAMLAAVKDSSERRLVILDSIDEYLSPDYSPFFKYLKGLRDQHKYSLAYVLLTHRPLGLRHQPVLNSFYSLATEHVEYLPALETSEYDLFGFTPASKQLQDIATQSGGIPYLVKACILAMRDGHPLNPAKLAGPIEAMLTDVPDHPAYAKSQLVQDYLATRKATQMSAAETRLLDLLQSQAGQIVSKDAICEVVYPDVKNRAGISDHALDQLVHRLRAKTKDRYTISTHRGLGYKLIPQ